jgi:hypothetical protein
MTIRTELDKLKACVDRLNIDMDIYSLAQSCVEDEIKLLRERINIIQETRTRKFLIKLWHILTVVFILFAVIIFKLLL